MVAEWLRRSFQVRYCIVQWAKDIRLCFAHAGSNPVHTAFLPLYMTMSYTRCQITQSFFLFIPSITSIRSVVSIESVLCGIVFGVIKNFFDLRDFSANFCDEKIAFLTSTFSTRRAFVGRNITPCRLRCMKY